MNAQFKLLLYIVLVAVILYFVQQKYDIFEISLDSKQSTEKEVEEGNTQVEILNEDGKSIYVQVEVADTKDLRALGLSGRTEIGDYQGMLFVMEQEDLHSFWMNEMFISLDLIFINTQGYIVYISQDQQPCTDVCPSIKSPFESKYILEVNSGFVEINRVRIGNEVVFDI